MAYAVGVKRMRLHVVMCTSPLACVLQQSHVCFNSRMRFTPTAAHASAAAPPLTGINGFFTSGRCGHSCKQASQHPPLAVHTPTAVLHPPWPPALRAPGLRVVAVARRRERLEELQRQMLGPEVGMAAVDFLPVVCDITKEVEVQVGQ